MTPEGPLDVHVHAGPSIFERKLDAIELAEELTASSLGGAILKSHFGSTVPHCRPASSCVPDVELYLSITLNEFVGGIRPPAVEAALATGVRLIWFPTFSAAAFTLEEITIPLFAMEGELTVFDGDGEVSDEVRQILSLVVDTEPSPAIGSEHLSSTEIFAVLNVIENTGLDIDYVVTHPDFDFVGLTDPDQHELAERGAFFEKCFLPVVTGDVSIETVVEHVREFGANQCVLSTDHGQPSYRSPPNAFERFVAELRESGLSAREVERSAVTTPRKMLGVNDE